jgi:hypothetical protein
LLPKMERQVRVRHHPAMPLPTSQALCIY